MNIRYNIAQRNHPIHTYREEEGIEEPIVNMAAPTTRIHLRPLRPQDLPLHPEMASKQNPATSPDLQRFVSEVLDEGQRFMTTTLEDENIFKSKGTRKDKPATAPIRIRAAVLTPEHSDFEYPTENWFARTSEHENRNADGTAPWHEFEQSLRIHHSDHEKIYTPSVQAAEELFSWQEQLDAFASRVGPWQEITMEIRSMEHKIPPPLQRRVFRVLVITASRGEAGSALIVVQIPVEGNPIESRDGVVYGIYCSVETARLENGRTIWSMATASDAKGWMPMWLQKTQMPKAVAVDVGYFIKWRMEVRQSTA